MSTSFPEPGSPVTHSGASANRGGHDRCLGWPKAQLDDPLAAQKTRLGARPSEPLWRLRLSGVLEHAACREQAQHA
jgi:hypothetical protein